MSVEELPSNNKVAIIVCTVCRKIRNDILLSGYFFKFCLLFLYIFHVSYLSLYFFYLLELELPWRYLKVILSDLLLCQLIQKAQVLFLYKLLSQQEFESNHDLEPLLLPNVKILRVFLIHKVLVEFEP
jgi:hypothetical protein